MTRQKETFTRESPGPLGPLEDLDEDVAPPLPSKARPRREMARAIATLEDEARSHRHHPSDTAGVEVSIDPGAADAAADLAGDLGANWLEGATCGEDAADLRHDRDDDAELPLVLDEAGPWPTRRAR